MAQEEQQRQIDDKESAAACGCQDRSIQQNKGYLGHFEHTKNCPNKDVHTEEEKRRAAEEVSDMEYWCYE
jgi:hypothetical protein